MISKRKVKLGIAPIAWTNDDMPDLGAENTFEQCISEMALAGFSGTEIGNKYPKDAAILKKYLDMRGLQVCNAWFSTYFTSRPEEETIRAFIRHRDFLHALGAKIIGASEQGNSIQGRLDTPILGSKPVYTDKEWAQVTVGLERLASLAAEKGMKLSYHHHMGTGIQDMDEIDELMARTKNVWLLYDTGHAVFAGIDHVRLLEKYISRIIHVHLKDARKHVLARVGPEKMSFLNAVREGAFTVPGDGMIDFEPVFKILEEYGYKGWFVVEAEQDPSKANPFEYALKARRFIKEKAGI
ncbi:MAG TPA: myo-inosose-2 dehydratase [Desulfomonilia bacterium]